MSDFLLYWKPSTVDNIKRSNRPIEYAASNQLERLKKNDSLWLVTVREGRLLLVGRFVVASIIDKATAQARFPTDELWEATLYAVPFASAIDHVVEVDVTDAAELFEFQSTDHSAQRLAVADGKVNPQQLQTMREVSVDAARRLDELWSRVLRLAGSVATVESSLREFSATAPDHRELVRSLAAQSEYWVYSDEDKLFAPAKFSGYSGMTFERYELCRQGKSSGVRFDGHVTRRSLEKVVGPFVEDSAVALELVSWVHDACESDVNAGVDQSKWRFARLDMAQANVLNPRPQPDEAASFAARTVRSSNTSASGHTRATKQSLKVWIVEALEDAGGALHHVRVAEHIWRAHEATLRESGDFFFTWQYDLRWAAQDLRDDGVLARVDGQGHGDGVWRLAIRSE